jgi:hypothetical protein
VKCENCNQEGFDALITLSGAKLYADGWCLDCLKKWSYANKHVKIDKPKIEYRCNDCGKSLYPQNGVTYVYFDCSNEYFLCREHGEESSYGTPKAGIIRYSRNMHLKALEAVENGKPVNDAINNVITKRPRAQSLDELFWSKPPST